MSATGQCPQCAAPLPPQAPEGNCPACLVRLALVGGSLEAEACQAIGWEDSPAAPPDPTGQDGADRAAAPPPGLRRLGEYTLVRKLGWGGAGEVWLGYDSSLRRQVALKLLKPDWQANDEVVARFLQEARIAAQLNHPNIVTVFQVGDQAGRFFLAMEYLPRGSLQHEVAQRGRLDWREATLVIRDAVCGLGAAHEAGIVHRDVKPGNLLRAENGTAKVADFGLARLESSSSILTHPGRIFGTPSFMAPEQIRGGLVDARADFYSLTCTYFALLTGHAPFAVPGEDPKPEAQLYRHVHEPFPDAREELPDLPAGVAAVLARGSQKDPACRYPNAWEFYQDLESVLATPQRIPPRQAGQPSDPPGPNESGPRPKRHVLIGLAYLRRNWTRVLAVLAASAGLVLALPVLFWQVWNPTFPKYSTSMARLSRLARDNPPRFWMTLVKDTVGGWSRGTPPNADPLAGKGILREATLVEPPPEWSAVDQKKLAAIQEAREKTLTGLPSVSCQALADQLLPETTPGRANRSAPGFELPERFVLLGFLRAVRVLAGKTWLGLVGQPGQEPDSQALAVLVVFDGVQLAEQMVDYRTGDAIRVVAARTNWGHAKLLPAQDARSPRPGTQTRRQFPGSLLTRNALSEPPERPQNPRDHRSHLPALPHEPPGPDCSGHGA